MDIEAPKMCNLHKERHFSTHFLKNIDALPVDTLDAHYVLPVNFLFYIISFPGTISGYYFWVLSIELRDTQFFSDTRSENQPATPSFSNQMCKYNPREMSECSSSIA